MTADHDTTIASRNTAKLNEVTKEFDKRLNHCCDRMTKAWEEREMMMNGIVARIVHFQVSAPPKPRPHTNSIYYPSVIEVCAESRFV